MSSAEILELVMRGAAAGLSALMGVAFLQVRNGNWAARLGGLFGFAAAAYGLVSSETIAAALGVYGLPLNGLAIPAGVFFWWFATAMFDDRFAWHWWRFVPLAAIIVLATLHFQSPEGSRISLIALTLWQAVTLLLMGHSALLAVMDLRDDLVEPRRRFRVALAILVGLLGVSVAIVEISFVGRGFPPQVFLWQGIALLVLAGGFASWAVSPRQSLFLQPQQPDTPLAGLPRGEGVRPEDKALARRLEDAMADGVYRQSGLSVGALAGQLGSPEHQLRKLINRGLGYRNFSSFLNAYRIRDAQVALSDLERAREQILTIALDLGYGSIAPFNRAFKDLTGQTPTAFRKAALETASFKPG